MVLNRNSIWFAVLVAALGYFVDVFDIILFSVVRTASLKALAVPGDQLLETGIFLINSQMTGMLLGGILWGVWGDKKGRLSVLFGSILMYSLANIANGFVQNVEQYAVLRFLAGLGLAGELGAGVTLVAEGLPQRFRGIGTTIIATVGVAGGLAASMVGFLGEWRTAYFAAGAMGLVLLALRLSVRESELFTAIKTQSALRKGSLILLFASPKRALRFLECLLAGVPIYFVLGILVTFAPEIGEARGFGSSLTAANAVFYSYVGFIAGDLSSGMISQWFGSRKWVALLFVTATAITSLAVLKLPGLTLPTAHTLYAFTGFFAGYWAVFITVAAEQFGTNLRATVTTSIPNLVRGMVVPMTLFLKALKSSSGVISASVIVLAVVSIAAVLSILHLKETFDSSLDFVER